MAGEHTCMVLLGSRSYLGGIMGETMQKWHFLSKLMCYRPQFQGEPGVEAYSGSKID